MNTPKRAPGATPATLKHPSEIADSLLGANHIPRDEHDLTKAAPMGPAQVRQLIVQAINADRNQGAPANELLVDRLLGQHPDDMQWNEKSVRVAMDTLLAMAQASGARLS